MSENEKPSIKNHTEHESADTQPEQTSVLIKAAEGATVNIYHAASQQEQVTIEKPEKKEQNKANSLKPIALGAIAGAALATAFCFASHSDINWPSFNLNHGDSTKGLSIIDGNIHLNGINSPVLFDQNSAELDGQDTEILNIFAQHLKQNEDAITSVTIGGHASAEGPEQYNDGLSYKRAIAVRDYLESSVPNISVIFDPMSRGENDIVTTPANHQDNRRVDFFIAEKKQYTR